jgi:hypothetical protein
MLTNLQREAIELAATYLGTGLTADTLRSILTTSAAPAEGREALAWRVEWERGGQTWVRTYTNERDAIDDGQAFSGTVTPLYPAATAPTMSEAAHCGHPMQPIAKDEYGVYRFKANPIVRYLLDWGGIDMNKLAALEFDDADREHFAQLIGYSVGGYGELSYVSDESYHRATAEIERIDRAAERSNATASEGKS